MSSTNKTTNYELSQFIGSDKPAWLVDYNGDMSKIDNQMKANADAAASAASQASSAGTAASGAADGVQALNTQINGSGGIASDIVTLQGSVNTITSLIGTGEPTTQEKTIIGAINEIAAEIPSGEVAADHVTYVNTTSGLTATNVQAAIDEVYAAIPSPSGDVGADDVTYDNTTSGLTATNVQAAIDELAQSGGAETVISSVTGDGTITVANAISTFSTALASAQLTANDVPRLRLAMYFSGAANPNAVQILTPIAYEETNGYVSFIRFACPYYNSTSNWGTSYAELGATPSIVYAKYNTAAANDTETLTNGMVAKFIKL